MMLNNSGRLSPKRQLGPGEIRVKAAPAARATSPHVIDGEVLAPEATNLSPGAATTPQLPHATSPRHARRTKVVRGLIWIKTNGCPAATVRAICSRRQEEPAHALMTSNIVTVASDDTAGNQSDCGRREQRTESTALLSG